VQRCLAPRHHRLSSYRDTEAALNRTFKTGPVVLLARASEFIVSLPLNMAAQPIVIADLEEVLHPVNSDN
jgi:hypothetical protein